jgi:hypothetical protein
MIDCIGDMVVVRENTKGRDKDRDSESHGGVLVTMRRVFTCASGCYDKQGMNWCEMNAGRLTIEVPLSMWRK